LNEDVEKHTSSSKVKPRLALWFHQHKIGPIWVVCLGENDSPEKKKMHKTGTKLRVCSLGIV